MNPKQKAAAAGIVLAGSGLIAFVSHWEGRSLTVYKDIVGVPTVCDGITGPDVIPSKVYTDAECNALALKHVEEHGRRLLACINVRITQGYYDALASWAYNVGTTAACNSTLIRLLNQSQYSAACDQLLRWDRAGGKRVRGLTNRRQAEHAKCVRSIKGLT